MPFVLDCSMALCWVLPDEHNAVADAIAERLESDTAWVPAIWPLEVGNVLLVATRRSRITPEERATLLNTLRALPIQIDETMPDQVLDATLGIADRQGLTSYDAAYLELAQRKSLPLATLDNALAAAAAGEGVKTLT